MKAALLIVLSLAALAYAGPFSKNTDNQVEADKLNQHQYMTAAAGKFQSDDIKQTQTVEILKQWCFASQMSQPELTASFKKLVGVIKSSPEDQHTEQAVLSERICQGAIVQKSAQTGETEANKGPDAQAHELIKDVYMDALISCDKRECMKQLVKIIDSKQVDPIRASYYMTRLAVTEQESIQEESDVKQLIESFVRGNQRDQNELVERQKLFAITAMLAKSIDNKSKQQQQPSEELKQMSEQVVKTIVERYIKPVSQQEVQQFLEQEPQQQSEQVAKKIAKRNAALKALCNMPGWILKQITGIEEIITEIATNKQEQSTARQSAIECLEQNESAIKVLKQLAFAQEEPIEIRVAAYRALMTVAFTPDMTKDEQTKQQIAAEIVDQVVKHCEDQSNQQTDDQFVLYAISHLDNLRSSQQPEQKAIKEVIAKNKQHYMQIQLLVKKFKQQLSDIRKSSRNYKLEQQFNQIQSGLILEGDIVYDSKHGQQQPQILPKMVRVNMSMPVMGETVNVVEITVRQNQMDEELLGALKLVKDAKFNSESVQQVVGQFKSSVEKQTKSANGKKSAEADLTVKVAGCTVIYVCVDDFKTTTSNQPMHNKRNTRSVGSLVEEIIEQLRRQPVSFNRGFNLNMNERLAKLLDIDANLIAGLRFESRASGQSSSDFEIAAEIEPRFALEAIVGPAKMTSKKLLQRFSTKTALGLRLRYKSDELVDVQIDLPMNTMELFTVESQLVERSASVPHSYTYLPESIYGQEDIYAKEEDFYGQDDAFVASQKGSIYGVRKMKRSIFEKQSATKSMLKMLKGKSTTFAHTYETSEKVARSTGLRGKLRVAVSPKDASFVMQAIAQKHDSSMQGYRVQVQKSQRGGEQKQYILTVSTPGSRTDRTMQIRVIKSATNQRTLIKSDIQCNKMAATFQCELIHDGRQNAIKVELTSTRGKQFRHIVELGIQRGSQSQTGRIATTYKPFVNIDSTYLRRPVQLQGAISYQQSPKSVITYELKCPTSGDFVQGKFILDTQRPAYLGKRQQLASQMRRSLSPIEFALEKELTLTGEIVGQIREHSLKVHQMLDWNPSKVALKVDLSCQHENVRKSVQSQIVAALKVDAEQQMFTVERKCPQETRKEFRLTIASDLQSASNGHQMVCELRYNGKRATNQLIAYKHKVDLVQVSPKKAELGFTVELIDSQRNVNEKFTGRTQVGIERRMKTLKGEVSSRDKQVKVDFEFVSLGEHQLELVFQAPRVQHRCNVRADQRQFSIQSRTEKNGQMLAKIVMSLLKQQAEGQLLVEVPHKNTHVALDIKLASGKLSSMAVQTGSFASKAEFSFDKLSRANNKLASILKKPLGANYRFKTDLKDLMNRETYWMESSWNGDLEQKSFIRMDSPVYRTDLEFDPREQHTKFGLFARSKRSVNNFDQLYSNDESPIKQLGDKLNLGDKLWMIRSFVSSPSKLDELKQKAQRALFEYADRQQQHKHTINWAPLEERVNFAFERQPNTDYSNVGAFKPTRFTGDLYTNWQQKDLKRPSRLSLESELMEADLEVQPFDGEESFARVSALSRHIRSPFSKHESQVRYNKNKGYKAWMKHEDKKQKRHSVDFESDASPKKWAKLAYESDKLGKGEWEHNYRHQTSRRQHPVRGDEQIYANKLSFKGESPKRGDWQHSTDLQWDEPADFTWNRDHNKWQRVRRSAFDELSLVEGEAKRERFNAIDYLKHVNARVNSQTMKDQSELYKLDFDYQPASQRAALSLSMPDEMLHSSVLEFEPTERLYKLQSKLINRRTNQPAYQLSASTKPVLGLASAEQEPLFMEQSHPMFESPIDSRRIGSLLFKQPLKVDYSDKQGRLARLDYDLSPVVGTKYAGLRQKRAVVYYKDEEADIEHQSNVDFFPESFLTRFKPSGQRVPGDFVVKTHTKYGPLVFQADSTDNTLQLELVSPVCNAKLTSEATKRGTQLIKYQLDNKQQKVQLAKIVRKTPILCDIQAIEKLAKKIDSSRFEHQGELLVSIVDAIFKVKAQTKVNGQQVMIIEGELNKQQEKIVMRVDGQRVKGQAVLDLARQSADLVLDIDDKRTLQHQTRVQRISDKFFAIESITSHKQQPLFKLSGKISALVFAEPMHLLSGGRPGRSGEQHLSTFEAVLYQPKPVVVRGQYDCLAKEARVVFENKFERRVQETKVSFDERAQTVRVDSRLSGPQGRVYSAEAKLNLRQLVQPQLCRQQAALCASDVLYQDQRGVWAAKLTPGEQLELASPLAKQTIKLDLAF